MLSIAILVPFVAGEFIVVDISVEVDTADATEIVILFVLDCGFVATAVDLSISIFKKGDNI